MKKSMGVLIVFILICSLLLSCGSKDTISEGAQAVLNATMNTPNETLFNPEMLYNSDMPDEEKAQVLAIQEEINKNWESLLGQYFSPGSFDQFLNSYIRTWFFADDPIPSKLISAELVSRDDTREEVNALVDLDGEIKTFKVVFLYNLDGLFYRVEIEEVQK